MDDLNRKIVEVHAERSLLNQEMYEKMKEIAPQYCKSAGKCIHEGKCYEDAEWKHTLRGHRQYLKDVAGLMDFDGKRWSLTEKGRSLLKR